MSTPQASTTPERERSMEALIGCMPHHDAGSKLIVIMVGLPATGKSYIAKKLSRYLNWLQHKTQVFNVGDRRRVSASNPERPSLILSTSDATFFDPTNTSCVSQRDQLAINTLNELLEWLLNGGGNIGILDATNSTLARRELLVKHIQARCGNQFKILFVESRCSNEAQRESNIKLKLFGPDYAGKDPEASLADFKQRAAHYQKAYVPLGLPEEQRGHSFVQMTDAGRKMNTHLIRGFILSQIVEYLLNFNLARRKIWISCNGESLDDKEGKIARHSDLSDRGRKYADDLASYIDKERDNWSTEPTSGHDPDAPKFCIWTSTWPQAVQTGDSFSNEYEKASTKMLDGMNAGKLAGLTFDEINKQHPDECAARKRDKLLYRWPGLGGEGYVDLIVRLRPLIVELERTTDCLVMITHRPVVRVLLTYFLGIQRDDLGEVHMPKETLYCVDVQPYGVSLRPYAYDSGQGTFHQMPVSEVPFLLNR